jgi:hypothetical protein
LPLSSFSSAQLERSEQPAMARQTAAQAAVAQVKSKAAADTVTLPDSTSAISFSSPCFTTLVARFTDGTDTFNKLAASSWDLRSIDLRSVRAPDCIVAIFAATIACWLSGVKGAGVG